MIPTASLHHLHPPVSNQSGDTAPAAHPSPHQQTVRAKACALRVLCVDDSATARAAVIIALGSHPDFCVDAKADAAAALHIGTEAARSGDPFDLFILDIQMDPIDGFELLGQLRRLSCYAETPAIFLSSCRDTGAARRADELGARVVKKSDVHHLLATARSIAASHNLRAQPRAEALPAR